MAITDDHVMLTLKVAKAHCWLTRYELQQQELALERRRTHEAADLLLQVHRLGCPAQSCSSWAQQLWTF